MKLQLVPEWRQWHKMWSVRFTAFGTAIVTFSGIFPDAFFHVWALLPVDIRAAFPESFIQWVGYFCLVLGLVSRIIKQANIDRPGQGSDGLGEETDPRGTD